MAAVVVAYVELRGAPAPPVVDQAPVTTGDVVQTVRATGTVAASETVDVGSLVTGTVQHLMVDFNDRVHRGEVLARLDPDKSQDALDEAKGQKTRDEATLESDQATLTVDEHQANREEALAAHDEATTEDVDNADALVKLDALRLTQDKAQISSDDASIEQAQVNLDRCTITSPIDGVVVSRDVNEGMTVNASVSSPTLYELADDLHTVQIVGAVDEADIAHITPGEAVRFTVETYPGRSFTGKVREVRLNAATVNNVVTYTTIVDAPNAELRLLPGMTAKFDIETGRVSQVVRVPAAALRFRPTAAVRDVYPGSSATPVIAIADTATRGVVWKRDGNRLVAVPVQLGLTDGIWTEVTGGDVKAGDQLITSITLDTQPAGPAGNPFAPTARRGR